MRTSNARRRAPGLLTGFVVFVVLAALVGGGCTVIKGTFDTIRSLQDAGFSDPKVSTSGAAVTVSVRKDVEPLGDAAQEAAGIVWRELPSRIESIRVTCHNGFGGQGEFSAGREELTSTFGPRPSDLDDPIDDRELRNIGLAILGAVLFGLVVLGAIITVIVVAVRRNRRPPAPMPPTQSPPWTPSV